MKQERCCTENTAAMTGKVMDFTELSVSTLTPISRHRHPVSVWGSGADRGGAGRTFDAQCIVSCPAGDPLDSGKSASAA